MTQSARQQGLFVTFEGIDGAGKSLQLRLAAEALRARGRDVITTREPGGSAGAEEIRALLVRGEPGRWSALTETLLFTAARRDHWERTIEPGLARGAIVLCDRFVDSTRAYQAAGRGVDPATIERLHAEALGVEADLTLIFDLDPMIARARGGAGQEDRFERFAADFHERLRESFLAIAKRAPERCRLIDAAPAPEVIAERVNAVIEAALTVKQA
ncbi:MAG: dTMP kinase [Neomegalonema sp.]|nr:dTMP kinase [Neomegalonema sp.]